MAALFNESNQPLSSHQEISHKINQSFYDPLNSCL
ncbi:hypothetical protein Misp06_03227 [Microbulbifer sp. NBRC 101763]